LSLADLPAWFEPLLTRVRAAEPADFTRLPTPDGEGARQSAVLILFGEDPATGPDVLVLQRADTMRNHAGQPAFPGGAVDPGDADTIACALREAEEEVGLDPAGVDVLATLPELWLPPSNFAVTPVLAWWRQESPVGVVDRREVHAVFREPIDELLDPAHRITVTHPAGYSSPGFLIGEHKDLILWGFTAGLINRLFDYVGMTREWDPSVTRELPGHMLGIRQD
jgi:8-oxo-dGTP pyrophosphatase MutT (NUDIX family)